MRIHRYNRFRYGHFTLPADRRPTVYRSTISTGLPYTPYTPYSYIPYISVRIAVVCEFSNSFLGVLVRVLSVYEYEYEYSLSL